MSMLNIRPKIILSLKTAANQAETGEAEVRRNLPPEVKILDTGAGCPDRAAEKWRQRR
jgi:hypothetical protein